MDDGKVNFGLWHSQWWRTFDGEDSPASYPSFEKANEVAAKFNAEWPKEHWEVLPLECEPWKQDECAAHAEALDCLLAAEALREDAEEQLRLERDIRKTLVAKLEEALDMPNGCNLRWDVKAAINDLHDNEDK